MVLFHQDDELDILLSAGGVNYALRRITRNGVRDRTPEDSKMVDYILRHVTARDRVTLSAVADLALQWKDAELWRRVVETSGANKDINVFGAQKILDACKVFSFEQVQNTSVSFLLSPTPFISQC